MYIVVELAKHGFMVGIKIHYYYLSVHVDLPTYTEIVVLFSIICYIETVMYSYYMLGMYTAHVSAYSPCFTCLRQLRHSRTVVRRTAKWPVRHLQISHLFSTWYAG